MRSDAVATVLLTEWALTTNYFDGAVLDGSGPPLLRGQPLGGESSALGGQLQGLQGPLAHFLPPVHHGEYPGKRCLELRRQP